MNQYKVLLVDDEEEVIQVIRQKIDWEALGFEVIGHALNGVEAIEMMENNPADVVLTDIKMPYMDGLTMAKQLKKVNPALRVIVFSGFDEFEYAKEAIEIEAEKYLLKPIDTAELQEVFSKVKESIDNERKYQKNIEKLEAYYKESLPLLQENFWMYVISGRIPEQQITRYMENYQIQLDMPFYTVTVLHVSQTMEDGSKDENHLFSLLTVSNFMKEKLEGQYQVKAFNYLRDVVLITGLNQKEDLVAYTDEMDRLCRMAKSVLGLRVTAGIGYECSNIEQLALSYEGARTATSYRMVYGHSRSINITEVEPQQEVDVLWENNYIQEIFKNIKFKGEQELETSVDSFIRRLQKQPLMLNRFQIILMEVVTEAFRYCNSNQIEMKDILPGGEDLYQEISHVDSVEGLSQWLLNRGKDMQRLTQNSKTDATKSFVDKALEYVHENYANQELNVELICRYLSVSSAYFSTVFKKETGKTFINYLTDFRMEEAARLLTSTQEKTYVIANKVGYADANYFSYVFKKRYGVSPSKYLSNLEKKES